MGFYGYYISGDTFVITTFVQIFSYITYYLCVNFELGYINVSAIHNAWV